MTRKKHYSEEFIKTAVARVSSGISQIQVAKELGISAQTISRWCIKAKADLSS